jgi:alginate O-acetyltransferase complex protein AlgI
LSKAAFIMFFNSYGFIFLFMPIVVFGFLLITRHIGHSWAVALLVGASLLFYTSLDGRNVLVLITAAAVNFTAARAIDHWRAADRRVAHGIMWLGITLDVTLFVWAKYLLPSLQPAADAAIMLGISFFTVQQIIYLVNTYDQDSGRPSFSEYLLFVTFFPYVIAGPVVRKDEVLEQLKSFSVVRAQNMFIPSLMLFSMGLFKKVVLADSIGPQVDQVFDAAVSGLALRSFDAWSGALLCTLQLYFDFSGYSDMAAGLAGLFGIRLPRNFHSPHKARSIMEFWQRWHMSMTRFFTEFIYLPLAVSFMRVVVRRRIRGFPQIVLSLAVPMAVTFLMAGIWHGAGANFVAFGLMMAGALAINHAWQKLKPWQLPGVLGWSLTMAVVVTGMVLDRADDFDAAVLVLRSMVGLSGSGAPLLDVSTAVAWIAILGAIVLVAPNTHEILAKVPVVLDGSWEAVAPWWRDLDRFREKWGPVLASLAFGTSILSLTKATEFLYYRF